MKKMFKYIVLILFSMLIGAGVGLYTMHKVQYDAKMPALTEINSFDNISNSLSSEARDTIHKSRSSTVKVVSLEPVRGLFAVATGTYFVVGERYFVLTVNHGIPGECQYTKINVDGKFFRCKEIIELNSVADYAIIEVNKIDGRIPLDIFSSIPRGREWKDALSTMNKVYFTGYPNNVGPFTVSGEIIGYTYGGLIYIRSYAWAGSSGSAVYTEDGYLIGYVLAVDVGGTEFGGDVLENVLIVAPAYQIDWDVVL